MFTRAFKRLIAKIGIAAVLFAQVTVAAYACPGLADMQRGAPAAMATGQQSTTHGDCQGMDTDNPNLCRQHCNDGDQSFQGAPHVTIFPLMTMPLVIVEPLQPVSARGVISLPGLLERATAPPPIIRFRVFRI